jgi:hypothetical protein
VVVVVVVDVVVVVLVDLLLVLRPVVLAVDIGFLVVVVLFLRVLLLSDIAITATYNKKQNNIFEFIFKSILN